MSEEESKNKINKAGYTFLCRSNLCMLRTIYLSQLSQACRWVFLNKYYKPKAVPFFCRFQYKQRYPSQTANLSHVYLWWFSLSNLGMWQLSWWSLSITQPIARQNSKHSILKPPFLVRSKYSWVSHQNCSIKRFQEHLRLSFRESKEQSNWREMTWG